MKKTLLLTAMLAVASMTVSAQDNPRMTTMDLNAKEMAHYMAPAWNLGNTMEAGSNSNNYKNSGINSETSWQSTKTSQAIIDYVAKKGFKSVRIPCAWVMGHITDKDNMTIDPEWMARVREIIDYCLNANLNVFINDHWDGGWIEYDGYTTGADVDALCETLRKLWTNIANGLKDYDERVIFGGMNEPGVGGKSPAASGSLIFSQYGTSTDAQMNEFTSRIVKYEQTFIDAVRATGGNNANRILVVQGPSVNIDKTVKYLDMSSFTDSAKNRLMVEVHYYEPYQFCQMTEDASWGNMQYYWQDSGSNVTSSSHKGTYSDSSVTNALKSMQTAFVSKGYPVIVGEYGAMWRQVTGSGENQTKHNESLQYWYKLVTQYCMQYGLIPFQWDTNNCKYGGSSSIDRSKPGDGIKYILDGITQGSKSGSVPYNNIYPTPSSTGVEAVVANAVQFPSAVYTISGMKVVDNASDFPAESLPKGLYIYKGSKYVVK